MTKILGICGSPRNAATEYTLQRSLDAAMAVPGTECEMITLRGKRLGFCVHCDRCIREDVNYCLVHEDDDMHPLYKPFYEADGYIIASPVYEMNITAQLVTFFNRFRPTYTILKSNPDYFRHKVGGAIAVGGTRNGGQECTINAIHGFYHTQGMSIVNGGMGVYAGVSVWSRDRKAAGAEEDTFGMENAAKLGRRVAEMALIMQQAGRQ
jgi:multimeric flavodoxin WrbA